jgi:hypothetical protein
MADVAVTNTFTPSTTIVSADVNQNFSDLVTWLNNRNHSTTSWTSLATSGGITTGTSLTVGTSATVGTTLAVTGNATFSGDIYFNGAFIGLIAGDFTLSKSKPIVQLNDTGTDETKLILQNASTTSAVIGTESSSGGQILPSSIGNSVIINNKYNYPIQFGINNAVAYTMGLTGLSFGSGIGIVGTTTNDNATNGNVGEYVQSAGTSTKGSMSTTNTFSNITSISLTAGDWDIYGTTLFDNNGATITNLAAAISTYSGDTRTDHVDALNVLYISPGGLTNMGATTIYYRLSLASTTTVYLKAEANYSVSTPKQAGWLRARRVR